MKNLKLSLNKNVNKKDYQWLERDFKKGETVYLFIDCTYHFIGDHGLICSTDGKRPFFEIPATALQASYEGKNYSIFMTEDGPLHSAFYCKEAPIAHMDLLTKIQSNHHLVPSVKENRIKENSPLDETPVLKIIIDSKQINYELIQVKDIAPLF